LEQQLVGVKCGGEEEKGRFVGVKCGLLLLLLLLLQLYNMIGFVSPPFIRL